MILPPEYVAGVGARHGFSGAELVDAVALVLATSGGDTDWRHRSGGPDGTDRRGLYGIDVVLWPAAAELELADPDVNTAAAAALYGAWGASWVWSPTWRAGIAPATTQRARHAVEHPSAALTFAAAYNAAQTATRPTFVAPASPTAALRARRDTLRAQVHGFG